MIGFFYAAWPLDENLVAVELDVWAEQVGGCGEEGLPHCVVAEERIAFGRAVDLAQVIDVALPGRVGIELDVRLREGQVARGDPLKVGAEFAHLFCGEGVAQNGVPVLLVLGDLFGAEHRHGLLRI